MENALENIHVATAPARQNSERLFGGRYRATRLLKEGLGVETLLGTDLVRGGCVVIKSVSAAVLSLGARLRLEHEGEVLSKLVTPEVAPLLELGHDDQQVYLVMAFVPGVTLRTRLLQGPLSMRESLVLARLLMAALKTIHGCGVLHRDIKPANVIVNDGIPLQRATLIDFGLSRSDRLDTSVRDQMVGTALYVAPEQAGLLDQDVTECSDLYSAGVVLFECLAGRPPFQGGNVGEVLRQHMVAPVPELRSLGLPVPRALDEVVQRLLRKDPRERYQSAEAVVADLAQIADALERGETEPALVVGQADRRHVLTEPAFVGRDQELLKLDALWQRAQSGQGGLILLEAESGGGKTRLLAELALRCAQKGAWVLRGQGLDQAAQRPFQVLTGVAEGLNARARSEPALAERIRRELAEQAEAAVTALPELALLGNVSDRLGPESFGETRSIQALTALLDLLGDSERPALVLLDDGQWSDQLTLKVINAWQRHQPRRRDEGGGLRDEKGDPRRRDEGGGLRDEKGDRLSLSLNHPPSSFIPHPSSLLLGRPTHVLIIVAFRSEEVPAGHVLRTMAPVAHLTLSAFQLADVQHLVESMAGPLPEVAVKTIEQLAEGSPFMASAALRGLVESGALVPDLKSAKGGWRVEPLAMAEVQSSRHAAAFLARRIEFLPGPTVALLSVGAVLGKEFDLFTAAKLAGQSSAQAITALDVARHRHIVWAKAQDSQCVFMHDKLRETLLARLSEQQVRDLHLRAAQDLESQSPQRVFELAYHFDAAGESERALPFALAAAEQARTQHSLEIAEQQYRIADRGGANANRATRYRIAEGLGDVLMLRGRYDEAVQRTEAARELAEGVVARARIEGKLGELAFKRGDIKTAMAAIERALEQLGHKVPQWSAGFFLRLLRETFVQGLHTMFPGLFSARKSLVDAERQLLVIRLYNRLTYAYWFKRGQIPCLWTHLRGVNLAEQYPPTLELAQAYSVHAPVMSMVAYFDRGSAYVQKSFAIYQSLGDLWGQGQASSFHGLVLYTASRYEESIEKCREAIRLLERTGDLWEVNIARYHYARSLYRLGELAGAVAEAKRMYLSGKELGDVQAMGLCLDVWSAASGGQVDPDKLQTEFERPREDVQVRAQVMLAEGIRLFMLDRAEEAADLFEQAYHFAENARIRNHAVRPLLAWLASALRRQVEKTPHWNPQRRAALLKRAGQVARQALKVARKFQNELPHALREAGLVAVMQGSTRQAQKYFGESLAVAERQKARYEHAQTRLVRGRVGLVQGWPGAAAEVATARQTLSALGADFALEEPPSTAVWDGLPSPSGRARKPVPQASVTLSLADRFDTVLDEGRRIASALSEKAIFTSVCDAALKLLRAEECLVLKIAPSRRDEGGGRRDEGEGGGLREEKENRLSSSLNPHPSSLILIPVAGHLTAEYSRTILQRALAADRVVANVEGVSEDASESVLLAEIRSVLCAPIFVRGRPAGCFYATHRRVSGLFGADEQRLAEFIATIAGAALENAAGFAELRALNETLEERVAERSAAVEARSLELARSNLDLEQFAYVASHDLQEPLRKVQAFGELLVTAPGQALDDQRRLYVERMQDGALRMQRLIDDLLSFARVTSQARTFAEVDLAQVAHEVVSDLESRLRTEGGRVEIGDLPSLEATPTQIRQLLLNLIGNALKFHREKVPPVVRVHSRLIDSADWCEMTVEDNGIGFEEKYLDRIFAPFQRLHGQGQYEGTGMGLAICRKIVERHGGTITARSRSGQGSTFFVTLPIRQRMGEQRDD